MSDPTLRERVVASFVARYGAPPAAVVRAPGRVNLLGEHTDYNGGFALPCAIDFQTLIAASPRRDATVRVVASDYGGATDEFRVDADITPRPDAEWANYIRGVALKLRERGIALRGADFAVGGNVPQGAGLSSSAALEVAVGQAFKTLQALDLDPTDLALIGQQAENEFVGCNCGIMDQLVSARGEAGHALLIDCRSLETRAVPLPQDLAVMIVHSRVRRGLVDSAYNERRAQCEAAARHFGVKSLRDVDLPMLAERGAGLDALVLRRARHVVTEIARTRDAADALAEGDLRRMGQLMAQSHASMRDDFEITVPAIDRLAEIAARAIGTHGGARMTGGGFGGCVVALMPQTDVDAVRAAIESQYRAPSGEPATVWVCHASAGAGAMPV